HGIPGHAVDLTIGGAVTDAEDGSSTIAADGTITTDAATAGATRSAEITLTEAFQSGKGYPAQYDTTLTCTYPTGNGDDTTTKTIAGQPSRVNRLGRAVVSIPCWVGAGQGGVVLVLIAVSGQECHGQ